jgi:hypothetical protein
VLLIYAVNEGLLSLAWRMHGALLSSFEATGGCRRVRGQREKGTQFRWHSLRKFLAITCSTPRSTQGVRLSDCPKRPIVFEVPTR